MDYPTVSNEEKRAQLEAAGIPWPRCTCCGLEKRWSTSRKKPSGGFWLDRCVYRRSDRQSKERNYHIPGTYKYNEKMKQTEEAMQKYIEGTPENIEYKEIVKARWQMK